MNMQVPLGMGGVGVFVSLDFSFAMKQSTPLRTMIMIAIWFQKSPRVALSDSMIPSLPNPKKKDRRRFGADGNLDPESVMTWRRGPLQDPVETRSFETTTRIIFPRAPWGVGTQLLALMV